MKSATTYEEAKIIRSRLETEMEDIETILNSFPHGAMGLPTEEVRLSPAYRMAKKISRETFEKLRKVNGYMVKNFSKEMRADREEARRKK